MGDDLERRRSAATARDVFFGSPGMRAVRAELLKPGPDEDPGYRELPREDADEMVATLAAIEPGLAPVLAEIVRQMDASSYTDGRPAGRLLPVLAEFVTGMGLAGHRYLSTACAHERHELCGAGQAARGCCDGPPHCTFCAAVCRCPVCRHGVVTADG
jgi:hypothetical protein